MRRVLATWLNLAEQAIDRMPRSFYEPTGRLAVPDMVPLRLDGDPLTWFAAERTALRNAVRLAIDWGMANLAWRLAATAAPYYDHVALYEDWRLGNDLALPAARAAGDRQGEANLLRGLAQVNSYLDNFETATEQLDRSLDLFEAAGDKHGLGMSLAQLSSLSRQLGRHDTAMDYAGSALELVAATGDQRTEAFIRGCMARIRLEQGRDDDARQCFEDALALCRRTGDVHREGVVLREVSILFGRSGERDRALDSARHALRVFEGMDDQTCIAYTLLNLGRIHVMLGDRRHAIPVLERAEARFRCNGNPERAAKCREMLDALEA